MVDWVIDLNSGSSLGTFKAGAYDAHTFYLSCGNVKQAGNPHSESLFLIVIKGDSDYYTLQWAERSEASEVAVKYDEEKWMSRVKQLTPIKLCPIVPGEAAPYPSCVGG